MKRRNQTSPYKSYTNRRAKDTLPNVGEFVKELIDALEKTANNIDNLIGVVTHLKKEMANTSATPRNVAYYAPHVLHNTFTNLFSLTNKPIKRVTSDRKFDTILNMNHYYPDLVSDELARILTKAVFLAETPTTTLYEAMEELINDNGADWRIPSEKWKDFIDTLYSYQNQFTDLIGRLQDLDIPQQKILS